MAGFVAELKQRRVIRALVGYGIAAFAVLQIIEPVMHGLHWPESLLSYVVVALGAGFPLVVTVAWMEAIMPKRGGVVALSAIADRVYPRSRPEDEGRIRTRSA